MELASACRCVVSLYPDPLEFLVQPGEENMPFCVNPIMFFAIQPKEDLHRGLPARERYKGPQARG